MHGEIPAHKIFEDEQSFAFLDIHPLAEGHTMIIPKHHYEKLEDLPDLELTCLFETVQKISRSARKALTASATTIGINNGRAAGQVVPHLHIHVIPRWDGDGGGSVHSIIKNPCKRNLEDVLKLLVAEAQK